MRKLCAAFVFSLDHGEEVLHLDHAEILAAAGADRHGAVLLFLLADDEDVRNLLQTKLANFIVNLFAAQISMNANARFMQLGGNFLGVILLSVGNAGDGALNRREPGREGGNQTGTSLLQDTACFCPCHSWR